MGTEIAEPIVVELSEVQENFLQLLECGRHSDVTFVFDDEQRIPAHRTILASQSEYFDRLLFGEMREAHSGAEILLPKTSPAAFKALLKYAYTGRCEVSKLQVALPLLGLADQYGFVSLKETLDQHLCSHVSVDSALEMAVCSDIHSAQQLREASWEFVDRNAVEVFKSDALLSIPQKYLEDIISRDSFVMDELAILEAVLKWKNHNLERSGQISTLLQYIRLPQIPTLQLFDMVRPLGIFEEKQILDAIQFQTYPERDKLQPRGKPATGLNLLDVSSTTVSSQKGFQVQQAMQTPPPKRARMIKDVVADKVFHTDGCDIFNFGSSSTDGELIIKFDDVYVINELELNNSDYNSWKYKIHVSRDGKSWTEIVNHSTNCYSDQHLYFPKQAARYLQFTQLPPRNKPPPRDETSLSLRLLSCSLTSSVPFTFRKNGIMAPSQPFTPAMKGTATRSSEGCLTYTLTFRQPYAISQIRFTVKGVNFKGTIIVAVGRDESQEIVGLRSNQDFMQEIEVRFAEAVVNTVEVTITKVIVEGKEQDPRGRSINITGIDGFTCQAEELVALPVFGFTGSVKL